MSSEIAKPGVLQMSLRGMIVVTTAIAGACGALLFANQWWQIVLAILIVLGAVASMVLAAIDSGVRRAFGIGFLASIVAHSFVLPDQMGVRGHTPAQYLLEWLYPRIIERAPADPRDAAQIQRWVRYRWGAHQQYFLPVGDQVWLLLWSGASGWFASAVYVARIRREGVAAAG
jgi:hypothetical protein